MSSKPPFDGDVAESNAPDAPELRESRPSVSVDSATCALCGQPLGDEPKETASDGLLVHARCEEEYEDVIYHREFEVDAP